MKQECKMHRLWQPLLLVLALLMLLGPFTTVAQAVWDGNGSVSSGNVSDAEGEYSLTSTTDSVYGYRFTVYDVDGNRVGKSVDFESRYHKNRTAKVAANKRSHMQLYDLYLAFIGPDNTPYTTDDGAGITLGTFDTVNYKGTSDYSDLNVYYDISLPETPTEIEAWLDISANVDTIKNYCGVTPDAIKGGNYIIVEPMFRAELEGEFYMMTMAEYAVYQSNLYGWERSDGKMANYGVDGKYSYIMSYMSGTFCRYLYATGNYNGIFSTLPVPDAALQQDTNGTDSVLLRYSDSSISGVGKKKYNAAADILRYQVGMGIYYNVFPMHTLTIDPNGGTYEGSSAVQHFGMYEGDTKPISSPTRIGYTFAGWAGSGGGELIDGEYIMEDTDGKLTAKWTPCTAKYTVRHWQQNLGGTATSYNSSNYTLVDTDNLTGTTGAALTLKDMAKAYIGFTYKLGRVNGSTVTTTTILADGSRVIDLYYTRNQYTVTLSKGTGISTVSGAGTYYYEQSVTINATVSTGYRWSKWTGDLQTNTQKYTFTMPASDVEAVANATAISYKITYDSNGGSAVSAQTYTITTNVALADMPTKEGYTFTGWKLSAAVGNWSAGNYTAKQAVGTGKYGSLTLVAQWAAAGDTKYTVRHYLMNLDGSTYALDDTQTLYGSTGATLTLKDLAKIYTGFTYKEGKAGGTVVTSTTILADGSRVIDLYYSRNKYTVTLNKGQGISTVTGAGSYYYGQSVTIDATVSNGYTWYRWTGTHNTSTQRYSFTMPAYDLADTAHAEPVLELEPITPNASYRESTEVISAFKVVNPSVIDYNGSEDVSITFKVTNSSTGQVIYTSTKDTVIIPANEEGLVYVKWTVPASVSGNNVTVTATIRKGSASWTLATLSNSSCDYLTGTTPDTDYADRKPSGWVHKVQTLNQPASASWEEWVYENGSFRKVSYSLSFSVTAAITPGTGETHWFSGGQWYMRSGYGICAQVQASISASGVPADAYTQAQYVQATFPEFSYSRTDSLMAVLSKYSGGWQFALTEYGNYHFTPVWFPDGKYAVTFYASDLWTPAGMLTATKSSAPIIIEGSMYDDRYVGRP